jgi:hypothetical protein
MINDVAIVIQGASSHVDLLKEKYKNFNIIFSTWVGNEHLYKNDDVVLYNEIPVNKGPANFNLQKVSTLNGIKKAIELKYKYILKIRSDMFLTNTNNFFNILDFEKLNFLCWHHHEVYRNCKGYLVDYFMFGKSEDMYSLWDIDDFSWCVVPEIFITNKYIKDLKDKPINFLLERLNNENDVCWIKNNLFLSSYSNIPSFNSKNTFSITQEYLSNNYLNFTNKQ